MRQVSNNELLNTAESFAAENLLLCYESQDFGAIATHFARYEKEGDK